MAQCELQAAPPLPGPGRSLPVWRIIVADWLLPAPHWPTGCWPRCCCCCCHWCGCRAVTAAVRLTFSGGGGGKQVTTISSPCYQGAMFHRLEQVQARAAVSGEPRRAATPRPPPAAPSPARPKQHTLTFSPVSPTELLHSLAPSTVPHTSGECQVPGFTPTARLLYILIISRLGITLFNLPSKSRRYYIFLCSTICKENTG